MSIIGDARTMLADGYSAAATRATLIARHGRSAAYQAMKNARGEGLLPPRGEKPSEAGVRLSFGVTPHDGKATCLTASAVVDKILQHHALSPALDTLDLSRVVSIALGQDVSEAFVMAVLADDRERRLLHQERRA